MRPSTRRPCTSALLALLACASLAHAQPAGEAAAAENVSAYRDAVEQGTAAFKAAMYADARVAFERAYAIHPDPVLLFNIASCWRRAGDASAAIAAYRRFLAAAPPDDTRVTLATQTIGALEEELARAATDDDVEVEVSDAEDTDELEDPDLAALGPRTLAPMAVPAPDMVPPGAVGPVPQRSMLPRLGLGTTAAGALVLFGAAVDAYRARTIADDLSALPPEHEWSNDDAASYRRGENAAKRARWLAISGAALTATGITVYIIGKSRDRGTPRIEGAVGPGGGQVVLRGSF